MAMEVATSPGLGGPLPHVLGCKDGLGRSQTSRKRILHAKQVAQASGFSLKSKAYSTQFANNPFTFYFDLTILQIQKLGCCTKD
jgi:hypothetical protein